MVQASSSSSHNTTLDGGSARIQTYESESLESLSGIDLPEAISNARVHAGVGLRHKEQYTVRKGDIFASISSWLWRVQLARTMPIVLTWALHLTISRGQTMACVSPQAKMPPTMHLA